MPPTSRLARRAAIALLACAPLPVLAQAGTSLGLVVDPVPAILGADTTLTAHITARDRQAPVGSVTFHDGATDLGSAALQAVGPGWLQVSTGVAHSCAVTVQGGVMCWGFNLDGQLGDGTTTNRNSPVAVTGLAGRAVAVAAGGFHTCALIDTGAVQCWGQGSSGQNGSATLQDLLQPTTVPGLESGVASVAAGLRHTCIVTTGGAARCWGQGTDGRLGVGDSFARVAPTQVVGLTSGVAQISAGVAHTCAVTTAGAALCWGLGSSGRLGDGFTSSSDTPVAVTGLGSGVARISAGSGHSCAITAAQGLVYCWGANGSGEVSSTAPFTQPTPFLVPGLFRMTDVSTGTNYTCALHIQGQMRCWGRNTYGQLGDGTTTSRGDHALIDGRWRYGSLDTGDDHTCAQVRTGEIRCWGRGDQGRLGDGAAADRLVPTEVSGGRIAPPQAHAIARLVTDALPAGRRELRAEYAGSVDHAPATSRTRRLLVAAP